MASEWVRVVTEQGAYLVRPAPDPTPPPLRVTEVLPRPAPYSDTFDQLERMLIEAARRGETKR